VRIPATLVWVPEAVLSGMAWRHLERPLSDLNLMIRNADLVQQVVEVGVACSLPVGQPASVAMTSTAGRTEASLKS
jgi:hypothetical protein